jgi:transcriptional regulator with XRE-family HTH domain
MKTHQKIRQLRTDRNFTQQDMADALEISQRAYSKIETGEISIKIERLEQIASLLNAKASDLIADKETQVFENVTYSQIGNGKVINHINNKERELYEKYISRLENDNSYLKGLIDMLKA